MDTTQALNILINTAVLAQKAGALSLDDAVNVRNAIGVFQKQSESVKVPSDAVDETPVE